MARSFDLITRYIPLFSEEEDIGEWIFDKENDGSKEHPIFMPYFRYKDFFLQFITDVASFDEEYFLDNGMSLNIMHQTSRPSSSLFLKEQD